MPQNKHARFLLMLLYLVLGWFALRLALPWLSPFLVAFLAAALLERPVVFLTEHLRLSRRWAAPLCTLVLTALVLGALALLLRRAVYELGTLVEDLPLLLAKLPPVWESAEGFLYRFLVAAPIEVQEFLQRALADAATREIALPSSLYDWLLGLLPAAINTLPGGVLYWFTTLLSTCFLSAGRPELLAFFRRLIPEERRETAQRFKGLLLGALGDWLRVQGVLLVICFGVLTAGFLLLRVDAAMLVAAGASLLDALPLFGAGAVLVPWAIICLIAGDYTRALGLLALFVVLWVSRSALEPKLMGDRTGLPPLLAMMALYGGFHYFGIAGLMLSPLFAIAGWSVWRGTINR